MKDFVRDSTFTCNVRYLTEAYSDSKVWNMQYSVTPGWHGTDIIPTFFNPILSLDSLIEDLFFTLAPLFVGIANAYQSYLTSYIKAGDPNMHHAVFNIPSAISWGHPDSSGEQITGVLNVGDWGFSTVADTQTDKAGCDFWRNVAAAVTNLGKSPPSLNCVNNVFDYL
jgi:hypothetical protein